MEDDEIDFSKIKSWFRKKAESLEGKKESARPLPRESKPLHAKTEPSSAQDEEVSLDFSKAKSFFSGMLKPQEKTEDTESLDFSSLKQGLGKAKKRLTHPAAQVIILLVLVLGAGIWLRALPASVPIMKTEAKNYVENFYVRQIAENIQSQYPTLPPQNIEAQARQQFQAYKRQNRAQVEAQQEEISRQFREQFQLDGQTYLTGIDPEYWMLHARNILENGHPGDTLRNPETREECAKRSKSCVPWDDHMYAPLGRPVPPDMFHAYVAAYAHTFVTFFSPRTELLTTMFYLPVILGALCSLPAFFIARRVGGNFSGFVAAFLVGIHPALLQRTLGGFADTDAYNVLFPLLILWAFLAATDAKGWKSWTLAATGGLVLGIYPRVWGAGWWYVGYFILGAAIVYVPYTLIRKGSVPWPTLLGFAGSGALFIALISGPATLMDAVSAPLSFIQLKELGSASIWPNVFTTVAEQNPASLEQVIENISFEALPYLLAALLGIAFAVMRKEPDKIDGYFMLGSAAWFIILLGAKPELKLFIALLALPVLLKIGWMTLKKQEGTDVLLALILLVWLAATIYASTKGIRYLTLLVPVFAIGVGVCFGMLAKEGGGWLAQALHLNRGVAQTIIVALLLIALLPPFGQARSLAGNNVPLMNDAWYNSLDKIKLESAPDAIITSWWDYGHWYKNIADRPTTFDGTSQNTPMAHWVGYALLTKNEEEAVGILRMLDCGSNLAFERLDSRLQDNLKSIEILHRIVALDREKARIELMGETDSATADEVLRYTHCSPPEAFFIVSDDLVQKAQVWAHFGSWDFKKAWIYQQAQAGTLTEEQVRQRLNVSVEEARRLVFEARGLRTSAQANDWIAPWPQFGSPPIACANVSKVTLECPLNTQTESATITVNLASVNASIKGLAGISYPDAITIPTETGLKTKIYSEKTLGFALALIPGERWAYALMDRPLDESLFTRLYYLNATGLRHFSLFSEQFSVNGNHVLVWKVDWQGNASVAP